MSRDPWVQRFDERADEDDRYARHLEEERAGRDAEKGGILTIDAIERTIGEGIRLLEPEVGPIDTSTWVAPPRPPRVSFGRLLWRIFLIVLAIAAGLVFAVAVAVFIIEVVAWGMSGP